MKYLSLTAFLVISITLSKPASAQFFKKLKKAVHHTVNEVSSALNDSTTLGDSARVRGTVTATQWNGTTVDISAFNPGKIYTLQPGEKFDFKESCLTMHAGISTAQVVIIKDGDRFLISENGKRIPVTQNNIKGCSVAYQTDNTQIVDFFDFAYHAPNVAEEASDQFADLYLSRVGMLNMSKNDQAEYDKMQKKMEKNREKGVMNMADIQKMASMMQHNRADPDSVGIYIHFNNKRYGPYGNVFAMMINKSKNKFVALVLPKGPGPAGVPMSSASMIISSEGLKQKVPYIVGKLLPYGDFNHYRVLYKTTDAKRVIFNPSTGQKVILNNLPAEELKIDKLTGAIIQITKNKIYVDGKLTNSFPQQEKIKARNIYISKDHSRAAVWSLEGLNLPDGQVIDGVLSCNRQLQNGKVYLSWIVLGKDNKSLFLCHKLL